MTEPTKNDPELLDSGTGAGLLYFFDIMIKRNEVNKSTGGALRTASRKYLELEDDPDGLDLRSIDHESMNRRFVNRHRVELNEKSLDTYAHRFRQASEMYLNFLDGKEWNIIKTRVTGATTRTNGTKPAKETSPVDESRTDTAASPSPGMTTFPDPAEAGRHRQAHPARRPYPEGGQEGHGDRDRARCGGAAGDYRQLTAGVVARGRARSTEMMRAPRYSGLLPILSYSRFPG